MFCSNCGTQYAEDDRFCSNCHTPLQGEALLSTPSTPSSSTMARTATSMQSVTLHIPVKGELAASLMIWTGHLLAIIGWIFAINLWIQSGKPLANIPMGEFFGGENINIGNPLKHLQIGLGFMACITGHVLQVVFFWAAELLNTVRAKV